MRGAELVAVHAWSDFNLATAFARRKDDMETAWSAVAAGAGCALRESGRVG